MYDGIGVMADDDFKQMEYMVVSCVTLATRAAIRGGVPPFVCYENISIFSYKEHRNAKNVLELLEIVATAPERFVMLVRWRHQTKNRYGAMIEQCKDYIALKSVQEVYNHGDGSGAGHEPGACLPPNVFGADRDDTAGLYPRGSG